MSYEGYVQYLCEKGHHWTGDAYEPEEPCIWCGATIKDRHSVDETNFEGEPRELILVKPAVVYNLKEKLMSLLPASMHTNDIINDILAHTSPHKIEEPTYKFGEVIKFKGYVQPVPDGLVEHNLND